MVSVTDGSQAPRVFLSACLAALVSAGLTGCCLTTNAAHLFETSRRPAWKTNLREAGFFRISRPGALEAIKQMAFGNSEELVVISQSGLNDKPVKVKAFVLSTASGKVVNTREWALKDALSTEIFSTPGGSYLTPTADGPTAFSAGLRDVLPQPSHYVSMMSPDARYYFISKGERGHKITALVETETDRETGVEVVNKPIESIGSNWIATVGFMPDGRASVSLAGSSETLHPYAGTCREVSPRFVSEKAIALIGCEQLEVRSLSGEPIFATTLPGDVEHLIAPSRDGSRFATLTSHHGWGCDPKLCFEKVSVFDMQERREVFSTEIHEWHESYGASGIALSPDGLALAVNSVGVVQLFRLPPKGGSKIASAVNHGL